MDTIGLGDPDHPIPLWLDKLNGLLNVGKNGAHTAAVFIILRAGERPDHIDAQFFKTLDESLALTHAKTKLRLDKKRLILLWNKADDEDSANDVAKYYEACYSKFALKWLPTASELLASNQILLMPKMKLGGGRYDDIETVPDKANALVHKMYDMIFPKLKSVTYETSPSVPLQKVSHDQLIKRLNPEEFKLFEAERDKITTEMKMQHEREIKETKAQM